MVIRLDIEIWEIGKDGIKGGEGMNGCGKRYGGCWVL
jgi:hypothetical protein